MNNSDKAVGSSVANNTQEVRQKALQDVLGGIFSNIRRHNIAQYLAVADNALIQKGAEAAQKSDVRGFYYGLLYPLNNLIDGVLEAELPATDRHRVHFLMKHSDYVENHYRHFIVLREGNACSADKTRWIMDMLIHHLITGRQIVVDRTQKYTFHLPTTVFTEHAGIVNFFDAVHLLYSGQPDKYLVQMMSLMGGAPDAPDQK